MTYTLKRVNISSVFKIGLIINFILFTIIGFLTFILPLLTFGSFSRIIATSNDPDLAALGELFGTAGVLSGLCFWLVFAVVGSVIAALYYALIAWVYNLSSRWIGGVQVTLIEGGDFYAEIEQDLKTKQF